MKLHEQLPSTDDARLALRWYAEQDLLGPVDGAHNLGILRGFNGSQDTAVLNMTLPNARYAPLVTSDVFTSCVRQFEACATRRLGAEYMLLGYVGITTGQDVVPRLYSGKDTTSRLSVTVSTHNQNISTMVYQDKPSPEVYKHTNIEQLVGWLGQAAFVQPHEGQIIEIEPEDYYGEPRVPAGVARMLLIATV